ncbi:MAG TPA: deoxynucleoside kinase [Saprospiraceae bacterium]|nr:deoxynucleoside kinase [Saprospiraceae bacterium]HPI06967.1 deoxynucleoside kinase [Saprospiraceae bacterium]
MSDSPADNRLPYQFIAIEGNIGVGKTTLCNRLAARFGCSLVLEQFTDNPFLPPFYEQPERYAFPVELFFMTERHKQLLEHFASPDLFTPFTVADYFFVKTLLFAKNNLSEEEFRLFQRLFSVLNATFPKPDLLLYLHRPVEVLLKQIHGRGREIERNISGTYLEEIQNAYFDYLKTETETPVVILELGDADFQKDDQVLQYIIELLRGQHAHGVSYRKLG